MRTCYILAALLFPLTLFAQSKELQNNIARSEMVLRLPHQNKYDSIIQVSASIPPSNSLNIYNIDDLVARAYFETANKKMGYVYMLKAIENDTYQDTDHLNYCYKKYHLDADAPYRQIINNFEKYKNKYINTLNRIVLNECLEIFYTDMRIRNISMYTSDNNEQKHIDKVIQTNDSTNAANLTKLMQRLGHFPGVNEIGKSFMTSFEYSVKHYAYLINRDTLYKYMHISTLAGQLPNVFGPSVLDKIENVEGRPLIYGEYGNSDDYADDGTYTYEPIRHIDYVDKRRAEFLLPPLYKTAEWQKCVMPKGYDPKTQKTLTEYQ